MVQDVLSKSMLTWLTKNAKVQCRKCISELQSVSLPFHTVRFESSLLYFKEKTHYCSGFMLKFHAVLTLSKQQHHLIYLKRRDFDNNAFVEGKQSGQPCKTSIVWHKIEGVMYLQIPC